MEFFRKIPVAFVVSTCIFSCASSLVQAQRGLPTHHVREAVVNGQATLVGLLPGNQPIGLAIMLPLRNEAGLDDLLQNQRDPFSPLYGQYLTVQEFTESFGPTEEDYDAVVKFAQTNGMTVTDLSPNRLVVFVTAPAATVERSFHVILGVYRHPIENRTFYAVDREPSVDLDVPLWHIAGLDDFSLPRPLYLKGESGAKNNTTGSGQGGSFLGSDRRAAYYGGTTLTGSGQTVGLFELDGYNISDVNSYFTNVKQTRNVPVNNVLLLGASAGSDGDDTEQVIDIIEAISMAPSLSQVLVYIAPIAGFQSGTGDVAIFNRMASDNTAKQISVSWAWRPADPSSDDTIFKQLASQGQSVFVASGDYGSNPNSSGFYFPAEDANVTAVGGTELTTYKAGGAWESEIAWGGSNTSCPGYGSGGGPSQDGIAIPSYQKLSGVINSSNEGSTTLRNVPDVAAEANCDNYYCANGSCGTNLGGTSLAAPTWAGFTALFRQLYASEGLGTVGFLNPGIYAVGTSPGYYSMFHDITSGDNYNSTNPNKYPAVSGYDLVTGWGSPNGTGWQQPFSFTAGPGLQAIPPGNSTTYTITGWASPLATVGNVALSVTGLPSGATGTFTPTSLSGGFGTSTLKVTTSTSTPTGTYSLTIKGTYGSVVESTSVELIVGLYCTPSESCTSGGFNLDAQITLTCDEASQIGVTAEACIYNGSSYNCTTNSTQGDSTSVGISANQTGPYEEYGGYCSFTYTWGGHTYARVHRNVQIENALK